MSEEIRLLDLANPRLPESFLQLSKQMEPVAAQLRLEPDAVIAQAIQDTGLDDFGEDGWQERLEVLLRGFREDAELSTMGKLTGFGTALQFLKNRLLLEDLLKRHPEILDLEMKPPIVIAGLARSGTTHLHSLLGADPQLRSLPWWEALEPIPMESEKPGPGETDPRMTRAAEGIAMRDSVMPHFNAMHEMTVDHVHEEIHLLGIDLSTVFMENLGIGILPTFRDYYLAHDQTPHYLYLVKVLKALQWLRGGDRWVLKSPQHLDQFGPIMTAFPGATFVVTHRDPVPAVASLATMISYSTRLSAAKPDPVRIGHYWADRTVDMLRGCVEQRDSLPTDRSLDVYFHEYMGSELETVERIYELAGLELGPESRAALEAYQREHPRGRFGRVVYDFADFDLDPAELRERFRFYTDRFPVRLER